nr:ATP-dependent helicase [uncultured Draconibacterium sp.]
MGDSTVTLSDKQKDIVNVTGNCVVNACPGSGKTFSVSARIAHLLKTKEFHHQGIAAISFTNTAWEEIERKLKKEFQIDVPIRYPHFLGTIDSFINKYMFLPYGHLIMKCNQRPVQVGEPHQTWSVRNHERDYSYYFDKISYNINGELIKLVPDQDFKFKWNNKDGSPSKHVENLKKSKSSFIHKGFANQTDSNFIAMHVLRKFPLLSQNIGIRFPYLIIDEAQDTTDVQMEIINLLSQHTKEIMLIGDPDQAIFEWNHAKPSLFEDKIREWNTEIKLDENRRSSQNICDCANAFLGTEKSIPLKNSDVVGYDFVPELKEYNPDNTLSIDQIKNDFLALCRDKEIPEDKIAIIYRSKSFGEHFGKSIAKQEEQPWIVGKYYVRDLVQGKYLYENGDSKKGFKYMEHGFHKALSQKAYLPNNYIKEQIEKVGFTVYRHKLFEFIDLLPSCDGKDLNTWLEEAKAKLYDRHAFELEINSKLGSQTIDQYFGDSDLPKDDTKYHVGTIHSVKGETYDAVLLFLTKNAGQAKDYKTIFNSSKTTVINDKDNEELRIVYVGITRARKILTIAVTEGQQEIWNNKLKIETRI